MPVLILIVQLYSLINIFNLLFLSSYINDNYIKSIVKKDNMIKSLFFFEFM